MPRKFYADCVACLMQSSLNKANAITDEALRYEYVRGICRIIQEMDPETEAAPIADSRIVHLRRELLGLEDDYTEIKHLYNGLILQLYPQLQAKVRAAADPLRAAIQLAAAGNYIDFGVLSDVNPERLMELMDEVAEKPVSESEYVQLRAELAEARTLAYLHDNCGEVALDKLLIETLRSLYPRLQVLSVVRERPILNDATMEDAEEVGLNEVAEVIRNGIPDLPGTQLSSLSESVRARLENADLLIAKGQGNFECLAGCGLNVYYLFLAKCASYKKWFGFERFSAVLQNDRRLQQKN